MYLNFISFFLYMFEKCTFWIDHAPIKSSSSSSSLVILIFVSVSLFLYLTSYILISVLYFQYLFKFIQIFKDFPPSQSCESQTFPPESFSFWSTSSCSLNNGAPIVLFCFSENVFSPDSKFSWLFNVKLKTCYFVVVVSVSFLACFSFELASDFFYENSVLSLSIVSIHDQSLLHPYF